MVARGSWAKGTNVLGDLPLQVLFTRANQCDSEDTYQVLSAFGLAVHEWIDIRDPLEGGVMRPFDVLLCLRSIPLMFGLGVSQLQIVRGYANALLLLDQEGGQPGQVLREHRPREQDPLPCE